MQEQLISYQTAKLAKEKGFNKKVFFSYEYNKRPILCHGEFLGRPPKNECGYTIYPDYRLHNFNSLKKSKTYSAPTQSFLQKWLREVHNIDVNPNHLRTKGGLSMGYNISVNSVGQYIYGKTYEEVLELGLQEALKLI